MRSAATKETNRTPQTFFPSLTITKNIKVYSYICFSVLVAMAPLYLHRIQNGRCLLQCCLFSDQRDFD